MVDEQNNEPERFSSYTTLHGLKFTVRGNHPVRRTLWTIAVVLAFATFVREVHVSLNKLFKMEITLYTRVEYRRSSKFPAVSFCNMNMMRKSKINGTDSQVFLDHLDFIRRKWNQSFSNSSFDAEKAVLQNGHLLKDILAQCHWGADQLCTPENFTLFYSFYRGLCYTFNSGKEGHPVLHAQGSDLLSGLTITLNAEVDEYYGIFSYTGTGFKVLVHDQDDYPLMENNGIDVSAGFKMKYAMTKEKFVGLGSPYQSNCREKTRDIPDVYSQSTCLMECDMRKLKKDCGCRIISTPKNGDFSGLPQCNFALLKDEQCVVKFIRSLKNAECNCPLPCTRDEYKGRTSMSTYPSPHFWITANELKNNRDTLESVNFYKDADVNGQKSYSSLEIFFASQGETIREQRRAYTEDDLISDIGGFIGLFLGCSLLTLGEFVDWFIIWCLRKFQKTPVIVIDN